MGVEEYDRDGVDLEECGGAGGLGGDIPEGCEEDSGDNGGGDEQQDEGGGVGERAEGGDGRGGVAGAGGGGARGQNIPERPKRPGPHCQRSLLPHRQVLPLPIQHLHETRGETNTKGQT